MTGSRIARASDFENPAPVVTFDKSDLDKSGYNNLQQLLEEQPFVGNGTFSTRGNNQDSTANGAASVSLRGLGADATLVLVNGRRVAISAFAESITTNFVDINTIPVAAIERLEVLKDGASAVYGADAVAGVVNVILRKDFDGFEVSGGAGGADGYDEYNASAIWGINGEDSNFTMILDYFKNSTLKNTERGSLGSADQTRFGGFDNRSSRSFPGSFDRQRSRGRLDSVADPTCPAEHEPRRRELLLRLRPVEPAAARGRTHGPDAARPQGLRRRRRVLHRVRGAAQHLDRAGRARALRRRRRADGADHASQQSVPARGRRHPIRRFRTVDAGARQWDIETDNLRLVLGMRGKLMDRWDWEVAAQTRAQRNGADRRQVDGLGPHGPAADTRSTPAATTRSAAPSTRRT